MTTDHALGGPVVPAAARDRVLRVLIGLLLVDTAAAMVLSITGLGGHPSARRLDGLRGWLGLVWFVMLVAVLWRSALQLRRLRHLLASRNDQLAAVAVTSHDWLWEATPDLVATFCSPGIAEMLGRQPEDVIGRRFADLVCEQDRPQVHAIVADAITHRRGWDDVELRWIHADGHLVALQGSAVPVLDGRGELVGFRGTRRVAPVDAEARRRLTGLATRLRGVLDNRALTVALQPIIDTRTGGWVGVEALARFGDNRRPDLWFAEAQEVGLGVDLELLAVQTALAVLPELPDHVALSLNASPQLILDPRLSACLTRAPVPLERIIVEITEHVAVARYDDIRAALLPLRERGLRLAIDDTGAGYASFTHVLTLHPDIIKLDRSLITDIDTDPARRAFVTAIVLLAGELGAEVTAEGVENTRELAVLASLRVEHAQGFLLARPTTDRQRWQAWRTTTWPHAAPRVPTHPATVLLPVAAGQRADSMR
jgi:PAS domain S-box-containing protein